MIKLFRKKNNKKKEDIHEYVKIDSIMDFIINIIEILDSDFGVISIENEDYLVSVIKNNLKDRIENKVENIKCIEDMDEEAFILFPFKIGKVTIHNKSELKVYNDALDQLNKLKG